MFENAAEAPNVSFVCLLALDAVRGWCLAKEETDKKGFKHGGARPMGRTNADFVGSRGRQGSKAGGEKTGCIIY